MQTGTNTNAANKEIVAAFIEQVWNTGNTSAADQFLSDNYVDHSLPSALPANAEGIIRWIAATGKSFQHRTVIEDIVAEGDKVMARVTMHLKHIGTWREIEPTDIELTTEGYRQFQIKEGKILAHWALIDGNTIENLLKNASGGCKV